MQTDRISFTSKINFVDAKTFYYKFRKGTYIDPRDIDEFVCKGEEFFTDEIRTCTAGGVIDLDNKTAGGFHFFDGLETDGLLGKFFEELFEKIKIPQRALVIGGKELKFSPYSMPNYKDICEMIQKKVPNVTIFGEHKLPWSESDIHYSVKDDTWTIHSMYRPLTHYKEREVTSIEDLNEAFKSVKLAEGDSLYINGNKIDL